MRTVDDKSFFDRLCERVANEAARAWFFAFCVLIVVLWIPTMWLIPLDTSQLIINTLTTIITFLLVALLQNSQRRSEVALQTKLDVLATGLRDLMDHVGHTLPCGEADCDFNDDIADLVKAIGIDEEVGTVKVKEDDGDAGRTD